MIGSATTLVIDRLLNAIEALIYFVEDIGEVDFNCLGHGIYLANSSFIIVDARNVVFFGIDTQTHHRNMKAMQRARAVSISLP